MVGGALASFDAEMLKEIVNWIIVKGLVLARQFPKNWSSLFRCYVMLFMLQKPPAISDFSALFWC